MGIFHRCATFSPAGYSLYLWYGDKNRPGNNEAFNFAAAADWGILEGSGVGKYVYRSQSRSNYYVAIESIYDTQTEKEIKLTHYFDSQLGGRWREFSPENNSYRVVKIGDDQPNLPDYKNALDRSGNRFVWRIVVNGTTTLNDEPVGGVVIKLKIDANEGPGADQVTSGSDGKFEFSLKGTNQDIWINQNVVSKIVLYATLEKDAYKYEAYYSLSFPGDFRDHQSEKNAKVDNLGFDEKNRNKPVINFTEANKVDEFTEGPGAAEPGEGTCGVEDGLIKTVLATVLCHILKAIADAGKWLIDHIFGTVFDAYKPPHLKMALFVPTSGLIIEKAYAQTYQPGTSESSIRNALTGADPKAAWVITIWKVVLGLANVFVVIVLLFLAIVNITHIQYDTYAIKKSLPMLIIGIVLANFSLFIVRMFVDVANVLTGTFMGESPGTVLKNLITAIIPENGVPGFMGATTTLGELFLAILFGIFAIIAFLIIGFLFYIRYVVILTLAVVAPLAFIVLAFPPTQGIFKQWWGWFSKFVFMKPISLFLVWLAYQVLQASGGTPGLSVWAIAVFLIYAAIIVPFKLGGAVMAAWGGLGKKAAGLAGKGFMKATEIPRARLGNWALSTPIGRYMRGRQLELEKLKEDREGIMAAHEEKIREKKGEEIEKREARVERIKKDLERGKQKRRTKFYGTEEGEKMILEEIEDAMAAGRLKQIKEDRTFDIYISGKAAEIGIPEYEASIANSEMRLEKIKDDQRYVMGNTKLNEHKRFTESYGALDDAFKNVETAQMELSMAKPHERAAKEAALTTARTNLDVHRAAAVTSLTSQINPETSRNYTAAEADKFINSVRLQNYQQTRYFAITGKRQADDAATDAENYSPEATGADLYTKTVDPATGRLVVTAKTEGVTYGPMKADASDIENFSRWDPTTDKAIRLSNPGASAAIKGKINVWRKQMRDRTMKGSALQEHSNFLSLGNNQLLEAATHQAWTSVSVRTKAEVLKIAKDNHIVPAATTADTITAAQLAALIKEHGLNTGEINQNAFADAILSQLQKADGGVAIQDASGADVKGVTGLGQAAHWHAMNQ